MNRLTVVLSTLLAAAVWAEPPRPPSGFEYGVERPERGSQVDARLARVQMLLESALHHGNRQRAMREALDEIAAARAELGRRDHHRPPPPPPPLAPIGMCHDSFNALVASLDGEKNPDAQLFVLGNAAAANQFRAGQVQTILSRFTNDAFRLRAMGLLARRMIDPQNAFTLYGNLPGAFDKQAMQQLLAGADVNTVVVAASPFQLQTLTQAVGRSWGGADRLAVLSARAGDQLVTAAQLRQLLELFSSGRDRLAAVQTMRRRLVDPRNAEVIAQSFWSSFDQREARRLLES